MLYQGNKTRVRKEYDNRSFGWTRLDVKSIIGDKKNIIIYIIAVLLSRVGFTAGIMPLGMATFGAINNLKIPLLVPCALITVTSLIFFGPMAMLKFIISAITFAIIKSFLKGKNIYIADAIKIMAATAVAEMISILINGTLVYDVALSIYNIIVTGIFYVIFSEGLRTIYNIKETRITSSENLVAVGIILAMLATTFGNISALNISIRGIISVLIVMILGWKKGASTGAATGISVSIALGLVGYGSAVTIATYGFCGLLAGLLSRFGKIGAIAGFILGNIVLAFYANGSTEVIISLKEIVVASVCLFFMPQKLSDKIDEVVDYNSSLDQIVRGYFNNNTIYKLNSVSEVIEDMANSTLEDDKVIDENYDEIGSFIKTLNDNTCKKCKNYSKCWKQNYHTMYETVFNSIETLQTKGDIDNEDISESICENKELLADGLNFCYQIYRVNQNWQQKMKEKIRQVSKQLKGVSRVINKLSEDITKGENEIRALKPKDRFGFEIGMANIKQNRSDQSGDSTIVAELNDGKYLIGISDGMGSGSIAEQKSMKVIRTLEKLLNTGFTKEMSIDVLNSIMLLEKNEEVFATLDVAIFDPLDGNTEFMKLSACPTYIKRQNNVEIVQTISLPVGVIENIATDSYNKALEMEDMLIMVTDGVLEADNNENWLIDLLKSINTKNPQRLADIIIQEAVDKEFGVPKDDMTVIVAKIK